jgi:hypothetical protein
MPRRVWDYSGPLRRSDRRGNDLSQVHKFCLTCFLFLGLTTNNTQLSTANTQHQENLTVLRHKESSLVSKLTMFLIAPVMIATGLFSMQSEDGLIPASYLSFFLAIVGGVLVAVIIFYCSAPEPLRKDFQGLWRCSSTLLPLTEPS